MLIRKSSCESDSRRYYSKIDSADSLSVRKGFLLDFAPPSTMIGTMRGRIPDPLDDPRPLRRALLRWYRKRRRDLPWRRTRDPYAVWVSEIMLQQTRVETVAPYFRRFLEAFPDVRALAAAPEDRVLKLWEGLGYYRRATNLHAAAKRIVQERGGVFPETAAAWKRLPGVGDYTAAAVASIAFGTPAPAVDGNVKRVLARLLEIEAPLGAKEAEVAIRGAAKRLLAPRVPGDFNQAWMDLGSGVCVPSNPRCEACPVRRWCGARARGDPERLPVRRKAGRVPHERAVAAVIVRRGRWLIGRRPAGGLLGGLWEFPGGKVEAGETPAEALLRELREELGVEARIGDLFGEAEHAYTHFTVTLQLFEADLVEGDPEPRWHSSLKWVFPSQLFRYALPGATRKILDGAGR